MSWAVSALGAGRGTRPRRDRHAFTLIEVLVATGLTLLIMAAVAGIFVLVSDNIADARATIEMTESLRATQFTLQKDLSGLTARGVPPLDPALGLGYIEIIEGPVGPCGPADTIPVVYGAPEQYSSEVGKALLTQDEINDANNRGLLYGSDTTVGDNDDILQFTTKSDTPFTGRGHVYIQGVGVRDVETQSNIAEVSWFLRGRTLYRRVLLVDPTYNATMYTDEDGDGLSDGRWATRFAGRSLYEVCDVSVRQTGGPWDPMNSNSATTLVANSLGDLTKRENRFGHPPMVKRSGKNLTSWPHDARLWGTFRLPTLLECSHKDWPLPYFAQSISSVDEEIGVFLPNGFPKGSDFANLPIVYLPPEERVKFDAWSDPRYWNQVDVATGSILDSSKPVPSGGAQLPLRYHGTRFSDDVILSNVVSFDVKVWDPGAPVFGANMRLDVQEPPRTEAVTLAPGEPGYIQALKTFRSSPNVSANQPIAYGAFVDLGWSVDPNATDGFEFYPLPLNQWPPNPAPPGYQSAEFAGAGDRMSGLWGVPLDRTGGPQGADFRARVYDSGSSHYERDGFPQYVAAPRHDVPSRQDDIADEASDGLDSFGPGIDDVTEREAPPPYDAELKAIQIKIRVIEPDSRQVREVTVVQDLISQ